MISFDQEKNAWAVKFKKDKMEFTVYLNRKDADACIDDTLCEDFGIQIASRLKTYSTYKKIWKFAYNRNLPSLAFKRMSPCPGDRPTPISKWEYKTAFNEDAGK